MDNDIISLIRKGELFNKELIMGISDWPAISEVPIYNDNDKDEYLIIIIGQQVTIKETGEINK
jgi:hypothetical protein